MSKLVWDETGDRLFETGVKMGVLYPYDKVNKQYGAGVSWSGLSAVTESPSGAEANPIYADDIKYLNLYSAEEFGATVEAYMYPDEFAECDGSAEIGNGVTIGQQSRKTFGLAYRTTIGSDTDGNDHGYKIHLIYGAMAAPSEKNYQTINDSPEAITFSWELSTTPVNVTGFKPTASLVIDSTKVPAAKLTQLENILYGTAATDARLPLPDEVAEIIGGTSVYSVSNYLTNVSTSNAATTATGTYEATLTAADGFTIENVIVTHNGIDVTDTAYTSGTGVVSISTVSGPIVIFATANAAG